MWPFSKRQVTPPTPQPASAPAWPTNLDKQRMSTMFQRPASLSFLIFTIEVLHAIPQLLTECNYKILETTTAHDTASKLYVACGGLAGSGNNIVKKAAFQTAGHTFVLDPEMVMVTYTDKLTRFAGQYNCRIIAAIWERASETAMLSVFAAAGLESQTQYGQDKPVGDQIHPNPTLTNSPNHPGLIASIRQLGIPLDALANPVAASIFKLEE